VSNPSHPIDEHSTPLTDEEERALKLSYITTREQLNEQEQAGILAARSRLMRSRIRAAGILSLPWLLRAHELMFGQVWKWGGQIRTTERTIGVPPHQIRPQLADLLADGLAWIEYDSYPPDEIAIRFHHRLVAIHPFVNGNGRHSRLASDLLADRLGRSGFTWGGGNDLVPQGDTRANYVRNLKLADEGDYTGLLAFART